MEMTLKEFAKQLAKNQTVYEITLEFNDGSKWLATRIRGDVFDFRVKL